MKTPPSLSPGFSRAVPKGDDRLRQVCDHCGFIAYENPKLVVGSVVRHEGRFLLCRRAIEPRKGFWTIPAGYMELHETPEDGARREAMEEACAEISISALLAIYSVPRISQVQIHYRATLAKPEFAPGHESLEVDLFKWEEIPWNDIAFPSVHWVLNHDRRSEEGETPPFFNPPGELGNSMSSQD